MSRECPGSPEQEPAERPAHGEHGEIDGVVVEAEHLERHVQHGSPVGPGAGWCAWRDAEQNGSGRDRHGPTLARLAAPRDFFPEKCKRGRSERSCTSNTTTRRNLMTATTISTTRTGTATPPQHCGVGRRTQRRRGRGSKWRIDRGRCRGALDRNRRGIGTARVGSRLRDRRNPRCRVHRICAGLGSTCSPARGPHTSRLTRQDPRETDTPP